MLGFGAMLWGGKESLPEFITTPSYNRFLAITTNDVVVSVYQGALVLSSDDRQTIIDKNDYSTAASVDYLTNLVSLGGFVYGWDTSDNKIKKLNADGSIAAQSTASFILPTATNLMTDGTHIYVHSAEYPGHVYGYLTRLNALDLSVSVATEYVGFYVTGQTCMDESYIYLSQANNPDDSHLYKFNKDTFALVSDTPMTMAGYIAVNASSLFIFNYNDDVDNATKLYRLTKSNPSNIEHTFTIYSPGQVQGSTAEYVWLKPIPSINCIAVSCPYETGNNKVKLFDLSDNSLRHTFTVGLTPQQLDTDSDGNLWVANQGSEFVSIIPASSLA